MRLAQFYGSLRSDRPYTSFINCINEAKEACSTVVVSKYRVAHKSLYRERIEYLLYGSIERAHLFTKDNRDMLKFQIYAETVGKNVCEVYFFLFLSVKK